VETFQLTYLGIPGTNYALDRSFNLAPPVTWTPQISNLGGGQRLSHLHQYARSQHLNNFWRNAFMCRYNEGEENYEKLLLAMVLGIVGKRACDDLYDELEQRLRQRWGGAGQQLQRLGGQPER